MIMKLQHRMASMRTLLLALSVTVGVAALNSGTAHAVCNVRGEYCDYPAWAANAFTNPRDRVPNRVLRDADRTKRSQYKYQDRYYDRY